MAALFAEVSDGVIRIEVTNCDGGATGSGFLIEPDLVATVAHVVEDAVSVTLRVGDVVRSGQVIGIDPALEVALVRASQGFPGHVFQLDPDPVSVGADVIVVGYPHGEPISLTRGSVSGIGREIDMGDVQLTDMIQTDAAVNRGNSGGPVMLVTGEVVGLVDLLRTDSQGIAYAVSAATAEPLLERWRRQPETSPVAECDVPVGPVAGFVDAQDYSGDHRGAAILSTFTTWADGISTGDYLAGWDMFSERFRSENDFDEWVDGNVSSYIPVLRIWSVTDGGNPDTIITNVTFTSTQDPEFGFDGQTCSLWDMNYTLVNERGHWRIDDVEFATGDGPSAC